MTVTAYNTSSTPYWLIYTCSTCNPDDFDLEFDYMPVYFNSNSVGGTQVYLMGPGYNAMFADNGNISTPSWIAGSIIRNFPTNPLIYNNWYHIKLVNNSNVYSCTISDMSGNILATDTYAGYATGRPKSLYICVPSAFYNNMGSVVKFRNLYYDDNGTPELAVSFTSNVTLGHVPLTVQYNDTSSGNPTDWSWNFGDGTNISFIQNATHTYVMPGLYNVSLTINSSSGSNTLTKLNYINVYQNQSGVDLWITSNDITFEKVV